jgi:hypothetical protein
MSTRTVDLVNRLAASANGDPALADAPKKDSIGANYSTKFALVAADFVV